MVLDELCAEENSAHLDRVGGPRRGRDRTHEGLVRERHVRIEHIEVTLVDGNVRRFAYRAAGMMQPGTHVREFDEIPEVLERAIAATAIDIAHERRPVRRRKHGCTAADRDRARGIARVLDELCRRRAFDDLSSQPYRDAHPLTFDIRPGFLPKTNGDLIATNFHADFLQNAIGVLLDDDELLFIEHLIRRNDSFDVGHGRRMRGTGAMAAVLSWPRAC